jgi:hypothetical protein
MKKVFLFMVLAFSLSTNAQDSTKVDNFQKTDEVLSKVVEKALNVAEKTGEFAIEQAPLLLKEFYSWHIAKNSLGILLGILIIILGYNLRKLWAKKVDENYEKEWGEAVINGYASEEFTTWLSIILSFVFGLAFLIKSTYSLVFILVAPKLYLIEYFIK